MSEVESNFQVAVDGEITRNMRNRGDCCSSCDHRKLDDTLWCSRLEQVVEVDEWCQFWTQLRKRHHAQYGGTKP